jgi:hypothetical protein
MWGRRSGRPCADPCRCHPSLYVGIQSGECGILELRVHKKDDGEQIVPSVKKLGEEESPSTEASCTGVSGADCPAVMGWRAWFP